MHAVRMTVYSWRITAGRLPLMLALVACPCGGATIDVSAPRPVGKGSAVVLRPVADGGADSDGPGDLLIHFHGAIDTIRAAMERAGTTATVVVVNQPGLSAAYSAPFRENPVLFDRLLAEPALAADTAESPPPRWRRVTLSCFSAGYGAVREILKTTDGFHRVDAIVAADSIYAGLDDTAADGRQVDGRDMAGFLGFAEAAAAGRKVFVISHSAQPTPYASTTETADYLLKRLGIERTPVAEQGDVDFSRVSQARRGRFEVQGFTGASGPAHLFHLRSIDRWWKLVDRIADEPHPAP